MPDAFLLWTPILILAVVALLAFIGCGRVGFDSLGPPTGLFVVGKCGTVDVSWDPVVGAEGYDLVRSDVGIVSPIFSGTTNSFSDPFVLNVNQPDPCYQVRVRMAYATSDYSDPVCIAPPNLARAFVSVPQGFLSLRSNLSSFVGMRIELGANPSTIMEVCALGRFLAPGNGTNPDSMKTTHVVRIVDAVRDVDLASVTVSTVPGAPGTFADPNFSFVYALLANPVILKADPVNALGDFYIVSEETDTSLDPNPEAWGDGDTPVISTIDGFVIASVFGNTGAWNVQRSGSFSFGPVNFLYRITTIIF